MKKIKLSKAVQDKLEAERLERNKVRLFDLMVRIEQMHKAEVRGVDPVSFEYGVEGGFKPGFRVALRCYEGPKDLSGCHDRKVLRIDAEDWEFEVMDEYLNQLQWRDDEAKRKQAERDAELRKLSPKQREVLGFGNWRDPLTVQA
jgi:hypothetical protein